MTVLRRLFRSIAILETVVLQVLGAMLIGVVSLGVFCRYVLGTPLSWSYELSILIFVWVTFLGAGLALKRGAHVRFDFLVQGLPEPWSRAVRTTGLAVVTALSLCGVVLGGRVFVGTVTQRFQTIPLSRGWMYAGLPVGMLCMTVHAIESLMDRRREERT